MMNILASLSSKPAVTMPFIGVATAYSGFNLSITAAEQGARVLVVARQHLHPPKLASDFSLIDIIDDDLSAETFGSIYDKVSAIFDMIVFIRENEAFEGKARAEAEELERLITEMHFLYLADVSGRSFTMRPADSNYGFDAERFEMVFS